MQRLSLKSLGNWVLWTCVASILLSPILRTPLVADDFFNPLFQLKETRGSWVSSLRFGVSSAWDGTTIRVVGNAVGALANNLQTYLAGIFGVPWLATFGLIKLSGFMLLITSVSRLVAWAIEGRRQIEYVHLRLFVTVILSPLLQIHALWSNDPVASYPMSSSYAAAVTLFCVLAYLRMLSNPSLKWIALTTVLVTLAFLYYETAIGLMLVLPVISGFLWRTSQTRSGSRLRYAIAALAPIFFLGTTVLATRLRSSQNNYEYSGAEISPSLTAVKTFVRGIASSTPTGGWRLSREFLNGRLDIDLNVIVMILALVSVMFTTRHIWFSPTDGSQSGRKLERRGQFEKHSRAVLIVFVTTALATVATLLQSLTPKVQQETTRLGQVYTFYIPVMVAYISVAALVLASFIPKSTKGKISKLVAVTGLVVLASVQIVINSSLSRQLSRVVVPNRQIAALLDNRLTEADRCQIITDWSAGSWPDYYETGILTGLNIFADVYWGSSLCSDFVRPD